MPRVVIEEAIDLAVVCQSIQLTAVRNGSEILKALIAKQLQERTAGSRFGKTKLQEFLR